MTWRPSDRPTWWQFAAWALSGASSVLILVAAFALGPLGAVPTAAFAVLALRLGGANVSAVGSAVGIGAWCVVLGWLNRHGPGNVCTISANGTFCQQEWAPWPYWFAGALFLLIPAAVMVVRRRQPQRAKVLA